MSVTVTITEAQFTDPRAGSDKFYRTFAAENQWIAQYGRNGTLGTTTKIVACADREAAVADAAKKMAAKVKKGYVPTGTAVVDVAGLFDLNDLAFLDRLADDNLVPTGAAQAATAAIPEVQAVAVATARPDVTESVVADLELGRPARPEDTDPSLPMRPMLASTVDAAREAALLQGTHMLAQLKYDGDRVVIEVVDGVVRVLNRQGAAKVKNVGASHTDPFTALGRGRWVFDGEVVGRTLVLFDMAMATDGATTWVGADTGFERRYEVLCQIADMLNLHGEEAITIAPVYDDLRAPGVKADLLAATRADGREGIILRAREGRYEQARRCADVVKVKNIKDADVVITALHASKDSATLAVMDAQGKMVEVGAASTIGKGRVEVGQVWVVTYLNVNDPEHPHLFQPRLVRSRTDKAAAECSIQQFAHAGANRAI